MTLSETFWMYLISSSVGFCLTMTGIYTAIIYKSKCQEISCCGLKVVRDVKGEEQIDQLEIERHRDTTLQETKSPDNI